MGNPKISRWTLPAHIAPLLPSAAEQRKARLATGRVVIVCGARNCDDRERLFVALELAHSRAPITLRVHGASLDMSTRSLDGIGRWAHKWAHEHCVKTELHLPVESLWGKAVEAMRNKQMAEAGAHGVIALPGDAASEMPVQACGAVRHRRVAALRQLVKRRKSLALDTRGRTRPARIRRIEEPPAAAP